MSVVHWIVFLAAAALVAVLAGAACEKGFEASGRRRFPAPGAVIDIGGRGLHGLMRGEAAGPMVVIEQGLASPSTTWRAVQDAVARFARVCTYDRAGYLWSAPASGPASFEARAADLHAWLAACGVPPPYVLVAHSFGGLLAHAYLRAWPQEVEGLVLVDTPDAALMFREPGLGYLRQGLFIQRVIRAAAWCGVLRLLGRRAPVLLPDDAAGRALSLRPGHFSAIMADMRCVLSASEAARQGLCPGAWGSRPLAVLTHGIAFPPMAAALEEGWSEAQQRLAALSDNSELIVAARSNHMIHADEPEVVVEAIRRVHAAARDGRRLADLPRQIPPAAA